ncbi:MAG: hypothetical protein WAK55_03065, partial [Xanthobacteraceae bacterium]
WQDLNLRPVVPKGVVVVPSLLPFCYPTPQYGAGQGRSDNRPYSKIANLFKRVGTGQSTIAVAELRMRCSISYAELTCSHSANFDQRRRPETFCEGQFDLKAGDAVIIRLNPLCEPDPHDAAWNAIPHLPVLDA